MKEAHSKHDNEELKKLISLAKSGDSRAFEEVYTNYYTPLFRYIVTRTKRREDAEDLTQTVFLKIWNAIPSWDSTHTSPLAFFFTVARNTLIDHFRKNKGGREIVSDEIVYGLADETVFADASSIAREEGDSLGQSISTLSKEQQEIVKLYYGDDLTYKEIASMTGKREDAIRQIHSRAIKKLREIYE